MFWMSRPADSMNNGPFLNHYFIGRRIIMFASLSVLAPLRGIVLAALVTGLFCLPAFAVEQVDLAEPEETAEEATLIGPQENAEAAQSMAMDVTFSTGDEEMSVSAPLPETSLFMGGAKYSYPIECPPGRNGLTPKLFLDYSSYRGNGFAGVGWTLELGSIQASTKWGFNRLHSCHPGGQFRADSRRLGAGLLQKENREGFLQVLLFGDQLDRYGKEWHRVLLWEG
jgi:hypothetical protein